MYYRLAFLLCLLNYKLHLGRYCGIKPRFLLALLYFINLNYTFFFTQTSIICSYFPLFPLLRVTLFWLLLAWVNFSCYFWLYIIYINTVFSFVLLILPNIIFELFILLYIVIDHLLSPWVLLYCVNIPGFIKSSGSWGAYNL